MDDIAEYSRGDNYKPTHLRFSGADIGAYSFHITASQNTRYGYTASSALLKKS
jgi:hypothetical protein